MEQAKRGAGGGGRASFMSAVSNGTFLPLLFLLSLSLPEGRLLLPGKRSGRREGGDLPAVIEKFARSLLSALLSCPATALVLSLFSPSVFAAFPSSIPRSLPLQLRHHCPPPPPTETFLLLLLPSPPPNDPDPGGDGKARGTDGGRRSLPLFYLFLLLLLLDPWSDPSKVTKQQEGRFKTKKS